MLLDDFLFLRLFKQRVIWQNDCVLDEEDPFPDWLAGPKVKTLEYVPTAKAVLSHTETYNDFGVGSLVDWIQPKNHIVRTKDPFLVLKLPKNEDALSISEVKEPIPGNTGECVHTPKCGYPQHHAYYGSQRVRDTDNHRG